MAIKDIMSLTTHLEPIVLESTSDSPTSLSSVTDSSHLVHDLALTSTPVRNLRRKSNRDSRPQKRSRSELDDPGSHSDKILEVALNTSDPGDVFLRPPSPTPITAVTPAGDQEYERYVNLVLTDCLPFYQISPTIYVVQGWDQRNNEPTVCPSDSLWIKILTYCSNTGITSNAS